MATPTRIQTAPSAASGSANTLSCTFGSTPGSGNTIIAYAEIDTTGTSVVITDNVNTGASTAPHYQVDASGTGSTRTIVIARFTGIAALSTTVTVNFGVTAACRLVIQEWSGIDSLIPFEQAPAIASGTSTSAANAALTPAETGELVVQWATSSASVTWSVGSGFTLDPTLANGGQRMAQYQVAGTSAVTPSMGLSSSVTWISVAAAYRSSHTRKVIAINSGTTFTAPADWPGVADKAEVIGGGGAGCHGTAGPNIGLGGGGGAYTYTNALTVANGATIQVGAGGTLSGQVGTDTWVISTSTLLAKHGTGGAVGTAGLGGAASSCVPPGNAFSGGNGGAPATNTTAGATGGGGAAGPFGPGNNGGFLNSTGTTGGTGGGGGGSGQAGGGQTANNTAGTTGGTYANAYGQLAGNGGAGGAAGGANAGSAGNNLPQACGSGGGGGASDGAGNGGAGGKGGNGSEWFDGTNYWGSGGGGGGTGQATSGSTAGGNGGNYGAGGGGSGNGATTGFGTGAGGLIVFTYTPFNPTMNPQWFYNRTYKQFSI